MYLEARKGLKQDNVIYGKITMALIAITLLRNCKFH
jgi:hypothetical protein